MNKKSIKRTKTDSLYGLYRNDFPRRTQSSHYKWLKDILGISFISMYLTLPLALKWQAARGWL